MRIGTALDATEYTNRIVPTQPGYVTFVISGTMANGISLKRRAKGSSDSWVTVVLDGITQTLTAADQITVWLPWEDFEYVLQVESGGSPSIDVWAEGAFDSYEAPS